MKISIPYNPALSSTETSRERKEKRDTEVAQAIKEQLDTISVGPEDSLLHICFLVDTPIRVIIACMFVLRCIRERFPHYEPKAVLINTMPSPSLAVEIEFGSFRDIGRSFV